MSQPFHSVRHLSELFNEIDKEIKQLANTERAERLKRYFKEPLTTYGLTEPQHKELARRYHQRVKGDLPLTLELTEELMKTRILNHSSVGLRILARMKRHLTPEHFPVFDKWIEYLTNWATTDLFCTKIIVELIKQEPSLAQELFKWTASENRWRKRSAVVSLVPIARKGGMLDTVFMLAEPLMKDDDDMVQKGVGWLLKEASHEHPDEVRMFLLSWKSDSPALILRIASEKLPKELRVLKSR